MKIVHLARLYSPHVGGLEKHLEKINQHFLKKNHQTTVITTQNDLKSPLLETINGVEVIRLVVNNEKNEKVFKNGSKIYFVKNHNFLLKLKYKINIYRQLTHYLPELVKADIIHVHDVMWWLFPFYPLLWKKVFITFHGYEGNDLPTLRQVFWHKLAAKLARGNICVGGFHQKWYRVKPTITTFGAVESGIQENLKKDHGKKVVSSKVKKKVIFIGRLAPDNGILEYLRALKILKDQGHTYSLDIYGDGPLLKKAKNYVSENKLKVVFHGFVSNAQKFIYKYDLAFISRYLGILEAMNDGVKVIAHFNNSIKEDYLELTPFADWITIVSSAQEIADAVIRNNSQNENQAKNRDKKLMLAQEWSKKQTWEKMADNYFELWQI